MLASRRVMLAPQAASSVDSVIVTATRSLVNKTYLSTHAMMIIHQMMIPASEYNRLHRVCRKMFVAVHRKLRMLTS